MSLHLSEQFDELLEGLGQKAADFFLAASYLTTQKRIPCM
jgi:hypothetical protein